MNFCNEIDMWDIRLSSANLKTSANNPSSAFLKIILFAYLIICYRVNNKTYLNAMFSTGVHVAEAFFKTWGKSKSNVPFFIATDFCRNKSTSTSAQ